MIETTLTDFLMTGRIGPIREGSTRAEVWRLLGRPGSFGVPLKTSVCWCYGSLEIGFQGRGGMGDRVAYLQIENRNGHGRLKGGRRFRFRDDGFRSAAASRAGLKRFMRRRGLPAIPVHTEWHGEGFLMPGGVTAWFGDDQPTDISSSWTFITERLDMCSPLKIPAPIGFLWRYRAR